MPKASGEGERGNNVNTNNNSDRNVGSVSNRRKVNLDIDTNSGNIIDEIIFNKCILISADNAEIIYFIILGVIKISSGHR